MDQRCVTLTILCRVVLLSCCAVRRASLPAGRCAALSSSTWGYPAACQTLHPRIQTCADTSSCCALQESPRWQVVLRSLAALEAILQRGSSQACGEVAVMFQSDPTHVRNALSSPQVCLPLVRRTGLGGGCRCDWS